LYDGFDVVLAKKLRARIKRGVSCYGRYMPRMVVSFGYFILLYLWIFHIAISISISNQI